MNNIRMNRQYHAGYGNRSQQWNNKQAGGGDFRGRPQKFQHSYAPYQNARARRRQQRDKVYNRSGGNTQRRGGEDEWYKITIPFGKKHGKDFILKSLNEMCRAPFTPVNFHVHGNAAIFFVNGYIPAVALKDVNKKITTADGYKMAIIMNTCPPPSTNLDKALTETIKTIMSSRYGVETKQLDMSKFHEDPGLKASGVYAPLNRKSVFDACVTIIKENIPDLESLLLGNNKIHMLEPLGPLVAKCRNLKSINLCNNKLQSMKELDNVKGMQIQELILDGNPLCDLFKDQSSYISAVRERFPKVIKLDGQVLEAPIAFDVEAEEPPPPVMGSFFPSEEVKQLVVQFLEQYFSIYDSNNREPLLQAYHEQAMFSYAIVKTVRGGHLKTYVRDSRNIIYVTNNAQRVSMLNHGKMPIIKSLCRLPATRHDPSSFIVDVSYVSSQLMSFTVLGVFRETLALDDTGIMPLRTFSRTFLVVPQGQGFSIINETLLITNATVEQTRAHKKATVPTASTSITSTPTAPMPQLSSPDHRHLVLEMSNLSGMNMEYSAKCLLEYDWNLDAAMNTFRKLQSEGSIPPQAFRKINEPL